MSFLAKYWNVVERAVSETGMNPGDIVVNLGDVFNNTETTNTTELQVDNIPEQPTAIRPTEDGSMSRPAIDFEARINLARRSARQSQEFDELEAIQDTATKSPRTKVRGRMGDSETRGSAGIGASKKEEREARIQKKKQLRKLGGGRRVRVLIDEVTLNGSSIWTAR